MADETDTTSEVARVLLVHTGFYLREEGPRDDWYVCDSCGVELETDASAVVAAFYDHQAVMLAEAGLLRDAKETGPEVGISPQIASAVGEPKRRLRACVENWPDAETGEYDPSCCRFPKSCSATVYDEARVTEADLEPQIATQEPAGGTRDGSAGRGVSGGLGERLRALGTGQARALRKELRAMADEVDRLEVERDDLSAALKRVCFGDMRGIKWGGEEWTNTADIRAAVEGTRVETNENEEA